MDLLGMGTAAAPSQTDHDEIVPQSEVPAADAAYEDFDSSSYEEDTVDAAPPARDHHHRRQKNKRKRKHRSSSSSSAEEEDADSSGSSSDDDASTAKKMKKASSKSSKKVTFDNKKKSSSSVSSSGGKRRQQDSFVNLINAAVKSHKKQEQTKLIEGVKNDVITLIQSRLLGGGGGASGGPASGNSKDSGEAERVDGGGAAASGDYLKRIRGAYKDSKRMNISGKFNSSEHKSNISSLFDKLDEVHNIGLKRIPHIDKTLDIHNVVRGSAVSDRMRLKKLTNADITGSAEKVIPEAEYASLTDAYGACMLYRYFFSLLKPYLDIPYIR